MAFEHKEKKIELARIHFATNCDEIQLARDVTENTASLTVPTCPNAHPKMIF